jgi:hypothetical protein
LKISYLLLKLKTKNNRPFSGITKNPGFNGNTAPLGNGTTAPFGTTTGGTTALFIKLVKPIRHTNTATDFEIIFILSI